MEKEIEISKELNTVIGYNAESASVVISVNYEGKFGFSKLENGVKLVEILKHVAEGTKNTWDDVAVAAIESLIKKLS